MNNTTVNYEIKTKIQSRAWIIWALSAAFFFYEFLLQIAPGVMKTDLMESFMINATSFGIMGTFYYIGYASMQVPAGLLLDRFGPRILLAFAAVLCALGTILFALTSNFPIALLARFITGLGSAFAMLGALVLAANWFPINRFALLHGLIITIGMLGAVFAGAPLSMMLEQLSWRPSLLFFGVIGILFVILIWIIIRDRPDTAQAAHKARFDSASAIHEVFVGLFSILKTKQSWITAIYGGLMYGPTIGLAYWGPSFIALQYGIDETAAAGLNTLMFLGWAIGCPLFGGWSDYIGRRKLPLYISSIGTLATLLFILYVPHHSIVLLGTLLFLFGFFTCGFVPSFSLLREQHPAKVSGTSLGFMNLINSLAASIAPPTIGIILDLSWKGSLGIDGTRIYSLNDYHAAFSTLPISLLIALLILPLIKETFCKTREG